MRRLRPVRALIFAVCTSALAPVLQGAELDAVAAEWTVESFADPVNRGGEITSARVIQPVVDDSGGAGRTVDAWVRCWTATGLLDARFEIGGYSNELSGDVVWRFDRGRDQRARWRVSPSGRAVVVPDLAHGELLRAMRTGRELHLKIVDVNGVELHVTVSLRGSSRAIGSVADACRAR